MRIVIDACALRRSRLSTSRAMLRADIGVSLSHWELYLAVVVESQGREGEPNK